MTFFLVNAWLSGCDTIDDDDLGGGVQIDLQALEAHTLPELPAVIDLLTGINSTVPITVRISEQPLSGELEFLEEALVSYEPQIGFEGDDSFTYEISSEKIKPVMNQVNIRVSRDLNRFPCTLIALPDTARTLKNRPVAIDILDNDRICGGISVDRRASRIIAHPLHGSIRFREGNIIYLPDNNYVGRDRFAYRICSTFPDSICSRALVRILVRP
ncbi:MAG: hypothetical protein O6848_10535 [Bacteroidetes bacterium]|nr:hypothetical protein [Bacteroidota bacterium]